LSLKAGETLGTAAGEVYNIIAGTITSDHSQVNQGFNDVGMHHVEFCEETLCERLNLSQILLSCVFLLIILNFQNL
jgi:hypothetical protein